MSTIEVGVEDDYQNRINSEERLNLDEITLSPSVKFLTNFSDEENSVENKFRTFEMFWNNSLFADLILSKYIFLSSNFWMLFLSMFFSWNSYFEL